MLLVVSYLLLGAVAGLIAGVFGLGGGIIIVPTLIFTFSYLNFSPEVATHLAVGTSVASISFTSLSAIYVHHKKLAINWPLAIKLSTGMIIGGLIGASLAEVLSGIILQRVFALYAFTVALQMWFSLSPKASLSLPGRLGCGLVGAVIGTVSGLFGIAGGSLVVPVLTLYRIKITEAIATAAVTGFPIALSGAFGYLLMGWNNPYLPENSLGYIYWPALLGIIMTSTLFAKFGAKLAHDLDPRLLKKMLSIILLLVAVKLLL